MQRLIKNLEKPWIFGNKMKKDKKDEDKKEKTK